MKEENPSVIPDYNVKQTDTGFLSRFKSPIDIDGFFTPFWPLLIVFVTFICMLFSEVTFLNTKRLVLLQQRSQMVDPTTRTKDEMNFIRAVNKELEALAPTDPAAAAILKDFFTAAPQTSDAGKSSPPKPKN